MWDNGAIVIVCQIIYTWQLLLKYIKIIIRELNLTHILRKKHKLEKKATTIMCREQINWANLINLPSNPKDTNYFTNFLQTADVGVIIAKWKKWY